MDLHWNPGTHGMPGWIDGLCCNLCSIKEPWISKVLKFRPARRAVFPSRLNVTWDKQTIDATVEFYEQRTSCEITWNPQGKHIAQSAIFYHFPGPSASISWIILNQQIRLKQKHPAGHSVAVTSVCSQIFVESVGDSGKFRIHEMLCKVAVRVTTTANDFEHLLAPRSTCSNVFTSMVLVRPARLTLPVAGAVAETALSRM